MTYYFETGDGEFGPRYDEFDYEPEAEELKNALIEIVLSGVEVKETPDTTKLLDFIISEYDLTDDLKKNYEDDLKDFFFEKAYDAYEESLMAMEDEKDWYGTKQNVLGLSGRD